MARDDAVLVGLSDAIEALREQLTTSMQRGAGASMRFHLEPIELTVQAAVTIGADGGVSWWLIRGGAKYENAQTQSLTLRLTPVWQAPDGTETTDVLITDDAGDTGPGAFEPAE